MIEKLKERARALRRDVYAIYLASRDPRVPWPVKALAIAVAGYALSPIDLIPDFIPVLGYLDDIVLVPLGILLVLKLIPPDVMAEHRASALARQDRPANQAAAFITVCVWIVLAVLTAWFLYRHVAEMIAPLV